MNETNEIVLYRDNKIRAVAHRIRTSNTIKITWSTKINDTWERMNEAFLHLGHITKIHKAWGTKEKEGEG